MAFSDAFGPNTGVSRAQRKTGKLDATRQAGRFGDSELVHATPFTQQLLKNMGGSGTRNPDTGLLEFFNEQDYLAANKDVWNAIQDGSWTGSAQDHYNQFGKTEGRNLAPSVPNDFNANSYLAANQDVADNWGGDAYNHFLLHGQNEGRATVPEQGTYRNDAAETPSVDPSDFASRYHEIRGIDTDFAALGMDIPDYSTTAVNTAPNKNPFHYVNSATGELNKDLLRSEIQSGAFRFNPDYYLAQNQDLADAGLTTGTELMNHFLDFGWKEGRNYAIENPAYTSDISDAFGNAIPGINASALPKSPTNPTGWEPSETGTGAGAGAGTGAGADAGQGFTLEDIEALIRSIMGEGAEETPSAAPGSEYIEMLLAAILAGNQQSSNDDLLMAILANQQQQQPAYDPLAFLNAMGYLEQSGLNGPIVGSNRVASRNRYANASDSSNEITPAPAIDAARAARRGGFGNVITF